MRPVFIVGAPSGGDATLLSSLARASGVWHARAFLDTLPGAEEAAARAALTESLVDREGRRFPDAARGDDAVAVAAGSRLALRIPFLAATFPEARFVLVAGATGPDDETARDDLAALGPERWTETDHARLVADPRSELQRLCTSLGIAYDQALLDPWEHERRRRGDPSALPQSPLASVSTASFSGRLAETSSSLLISTYQTGKLICAREQGGRLNTHFRDFDKPMGIAVAPGRFCLGTRTEVWDLRDVPAVAPKVEPAGTHDACYLPRNRHVTGDIAIHEMAFAEGELWIVATAFSCLATLDANHSFLPRWKPPFVSAAGPGDRCHLNGMAVVDGAVRYVTALGQTDSPGAWREGKAAGGVIVDVPSSEVVVTGLSMPHSPRWHGGRLWVLESGRGALCSVDLDSGTSEVVVELPGFTRGLAFAGGTAFVGLSQIRESSTFGDLPLTQRLAERLCGVWMVDLASGTVQGFLRFDDLVQEVFDVALLTGHRYPEIAEMGSTAVASSFVLP